MCRVRRLRYSLLRQPSRCRQTVGKSWALGPAMFRYSHVPPTIGVPISADHRGLRSETAARRASVLTIARPLLNYQIVSRELALLELDGADRVVAEPLGTKDSIPREGPKATIT